MKLLYTPALKLFSCLHWLGEVLVAAAVRFYWDDCFSRAAALAYATLFALVPIAALSFSVAGIFGLGSEQLVEVLRGVMTQLLPKLESTDLQEQLLLHIRLFSENVRSLNTLSLIALAFTSAALLNTIESALNVVWRVTTTRGIFNKAANFWFVVSLGPTLMALSVVFSARFSGFYTADTETITRYHWIVVNVLPVLISSLGITVLFYKLPSARVNLVDAVIGGVFAGALFEISKRIFAYYVSLSSTYSTVYGVVASIPLFLFWLYVAWLVILFGAEISYQSGSIHILKGRSKYATELGEIGAILGLRILYCIGRSFVEGKAPPSEGEIAIETGTDPVLVRTCLEVLREANIITAADERTHSRTLVVSPEKLTVAAVAHTFRSKGFRRRLERGLTEAQESLFLDLFRKLPSGNTSANGGSKKGRKVGECTLAELIRVEDF